MPTVLGCRSRTFGKEIESKRLVGGTIFVDHATNFITHQHQINLTATETVCSKHLSKSLYSDHGVVVKEYIADNHPFNAKLWIQDIENQHQEMNISGVGAHH